MKRIRLLTGKEKINSEQLFQKATTTDFRGHSLKLYKNSSQLDIRKTFFSQRIVDHCNKLPDDTVSAATISSFKNKLPGRYLDGEIWTLRANSLTSPLTVTVNSIHL